MKVQVSWDITPYRMVNTDISEECNAAICSIKMKALRFSETSVTIYQSTRRNIPGDLYLHLVLLGSRYQEDTTRQTQYDVLLYIPGLFLSNKPQSRHKTVTTVFTQV
jgi:hypothetical protein